MKLYYSPGACSIAPHILLEESEAEFEAIRVVLANGENLKPEYLAINPAARVPALDIDGRILTENVAIISYVGHRFAGQNLLCLDDLTKFARVMEISSFLSSSLHIAYAQLWRSERFTSDPALGVPLSLAAKPNIERHNAVIEAWLPTDGWIVGDHFTAADAYLLPFYRWGRRIGVDLSALPNWTAHTRRVIERPAVQRVLAREGLAASEFAPENATA